MAGHIDEPPFVPVAEIEVDVVRPGPDGFALDGRGADGADYRMEMHLDLPVDQRTRTVLAEILSQSEWRVLRRVRPSLSDRRSRRRGRTTSQS